MAGPVRSQWTRQGVLGGREGAVRTRGYLRGGPEAVAALARLEQGLKDELLQKATLAGAEVLADAWRARVLSLIGIGPGVLHYAEAIEAKAKPGKIGATGLVQLKKLADTDEEAQPRRYAPRWEFGSAAYSKASLKAGTSGGRRVRSAKPTARPSFDASKAQMLDAVADELRDLIEEAT